MKYDNNKSLTENALAGVDITTTPKIEYRLVYEYSAPTFYDADTEKELFDECQASPQRYWVVSYDTENDEIIDWLMDFMLHEEDKARAYIEGLKKGE